MDHRQGTYPSSLHESRWEISNLGSHYLLLDSTLFFIETVIAIIGSHTLRDGAKHAPDFKLHTS